MAGRRIASRIRCAPPVRRRRLWECAIDGSYPCRTMPRSSKIREIDLKPYQTHFLFQSDSALTSKRIDQLLKELPAIIDDGVEDKDEKCEVLGQSPPRVLQDEQIAWLTYSKRTTVRWAVGPDAPKDLEHHLVVLTARSLFLSVVATDKSLGAKLARGRSGKEWSTLKRVLFSRLERALVSGTTRALWLSGIHRSVATKPDSKVLIGPDVEASLDALGDQSYQYTSTRCEGPDTLPASFVGVTPRMAKVWMGPSADWEVFVANSQRLLYLIESPGVKKATPYPVLARAEVAIHNHMVGTQREVIFLHYWGRGPADKLAAGFKAALDQLGKGGQH